MIKYFMPFLLLYSAIYASEYQFGRGYEFSDALKIGGYFSVDYKHGEVENRTRLDDVAILAYGNLNERISYLAELEASPFYEYKFDDKTSILKKEFHRERIYFDYKSSESLNFRAGKFITPIGYWNLEPINVLRETSSNPLFSSQIFPKFVTGLSLYGYLPIGSSLQYNIIAQNTKDLDEEYINIKNDSFYALSLKNEVNFNFEYGGSLGQYITYDSSSNRFIEFNFKYDMYDYMIQSEMAYLSIDDAKSSKTYFKESAYIQALYRLNHKNSLVYRYEYYHDDQNYGVQNISTFGYSYRPLYSLSIKGEYQYNSQQKLSNMLCSFSVLF